MWGPKQDISTVCRSAYLEIRRISSVCQYLTVEETQTLVCAFVLSRLDYCKFLLSGCPLYVLSRLQKVHNSAAKLVFKARKCDHVHVGQIRRYKNDRCIIFIIIIK